MILSVQSQSNVVAQWNPNVKYGGTFIYGLLGDPATLNPAISVELSTNAVGGVLYEPLFNYDIELNPHPNLAKDIVLGSDGLTYTVHLVQNATFTDGTPITSADVKFTYDMVLSKYHGKASALWTLGFLTANKSITTPDPYTVVFKLNSPFLGFPASIGALNIIPILPKHVYEGTDILKNPNNNVPTVTSGPYKFQEWVKGDHITLVPNEKWFRGKPYLDKIVFKIIPDQSMMVAALENSEVNFVPWYVIAPSNVVKLSKDPNLVVYSGNGVEAANPIVDLGFNLKPGHPITTDHRVREAFMRVIDRKYIVDKVQFGVGVEGTGPIANNDPWYDKSLPAYIEQLYGKTGSAEDISIANQLLDQAGYPKKADGTRLTLQLLLRKDQTVQVKAGEVIREQMKQVGVDVALQILDVTAFTDLTSNWKYDLQIQWWTSIPDPTISVARLYSSKNIVPIPAANSYYYNSTEADNLLNQAATETNLAKRMDLWAQFQKLIVRDLPKIVLFDIGEPQSYTATFQDVCGPNNPFTYCHFNMRYVWWSQGTSPVTATTAATTTPAPTQAPPDNTAMIVAAVIVVIVVAAGVLLYTRKAKSNWTKKDQK
jgi:peptide/nickel transport system substrate-binding protein